MNNQVEVNGMVIESTERPCFIVDSPYREVHNQDDPSHGWPFFGSCSDFIFFNIIALQAINAENPADGWFRLTAFQ